MKKVLNFFCNTQKGEKAMQIVSAIIIITFVIGLLLSLPLIWMGKAYHSTWMDAVAPYLFLPFALHAGLIVFVFAPYMSYVANSEKYKGDGKGFMRGMSIFLSIIPGAIIYNPIAKVLYIPSGIHNFAGMLICGLIYLLIVKAILRKPFRTAQTFVSLD